MKPDKSWYEFIQDLTVEHDEQGMPISIDYDKDYKEIELGKLSPLEYAAYLIVFNLEHKQWHKIRAVNEISGGLMATGNGINFIETDSIEEDEENDYFYYIGCIYDLSHEQFNDEHESITERAINHPYARHQLMLELEHYLKAGKKIAYKYIQFISNSLCGELKKPTYTKSSINFWLYPVLRDVVKEITNTFNIQVSRNETSDTDCALSIVVDATNKLKLTKSFDTEIHVEITYETLKKEFYKNKVIAYFEGEGASPKDIKGLKESLKKLGEN